MNLLNKLSKSFLDATKGNESFNFVIWFWGAFFYFPALLFFEDLDKKIKNHSVLIAVALTLATYFLWHIYATIKCAPKTIKLNAEEKKIEKLKKGGFSNVFFRKLFLQEPITKMNPRNIVIIIDLYFFLHFMTLI